jgi:hypothetical protein
VLCAGAAVMKRWSWTDEQVRELADAMDQLLDDMGQHNQSVCLFAKAKARVAWEPFRECGDADANEFYMTLAEAQKIIAETER